MNRFKMQGYVSEFPFLNQLQEKELNAHDVEFIKISKVDENLLNKIPEYEGATGSMVGIDTGEMVYFILNTGEIIKNAVKTKGFVHHNEAHSDDEWWNGETVLEATDRHGVVDKLTHIVVETYGYDIRDHYSEGGLNFTIYKAGKGNTIAKMIETEKVKALEIVRAEANF